MYRPVLPPPRHSERWQESWGRLLAPLSLWIFVSVVLRYGYYGDYRMVLGPSSSRLMKASSVFVKQVQVRDYDRKGVLLYGFSEKPELSLETNWSVSSNMTVASYSRKGFYLWLNKGSRIRMRWEGQTSGFNLLQVDMIKGEGKYKTLVPNLTSSPVALNLTEPINGQEADYTIGEDDKYYLSLTNRNPRSIITTLKVNVTAKMYDLSKARNMCSSIKGSCKLKLQFPKTQYVILTTPDNGDLFGWYIELSFVARVITYFAILGFIMAFIYMALKCFGACDPDQNTITETGGGEVSETEPIIPDKAIHFTYGTNKEDNEDGSSSTSSEDLYDAKLCVICYDDQRNCFFIPCGHCATCYDCAQRIMEEDNKICPICRRVIHKVRRLFSP